MEYLEENLDEWLAEELEVKHIIMYEQAAQVLPCKICTDMEWHTQQGWRVLLVLDATSSLMTLLWSIGSSRLTRADQCAYCFPSSICIAAALRFR